MAKLSNIFNNINSYETTKQKYFADRLAESFSIMEGVSDKGFNLYTVESKIYTEAINYKTLKEALAFIDGIVEQSEINEGFVDNIVKGVKKVAKKIKDAVVNWWNGPIKSALKKFHSDIAPAYKELKTKGATKEIKSPAEEQKKLNASLEIQLTNDYLIEEELPTPEKDLSLEEDEPEDGNERVSKIVKLLAMKKKIDTPKKTGSSQKRLRFFKITKTGVILTMYVGASADNMNVLLTYMGAKSKIYLNMSTDVVKSQLEMEFVADLIRGMMSSDIFKLNEYVTDLSQAGKKITLAGKKTIKLIPGKMAIIPVAGKVGQPIKVKNAKTPSEFESVFTGATEAKEDVTEAPKREDFKSDEEFAKAQADFGNQQSKGDGYDTNDFGKGDDGSETSEESNNETDTASTEELTTNITRYFGMTIEDIDNSKIDDAIGNLSDSGKLTVDNIDETNQRLADVLEYFSSKNGGKIPTEDIKGINEDFNAIVNYAYLVAFNKALETSEDKPALKARVIKLVDELNKMSNKHGVAVEIDEDTWGDSFKSIDTSSETVIDDTIDTEDGKLKDFETTYLTLFGNNHPEGNATLFFNGGETENQFTAAEASEFKSRIDLIVKDNKKKKDLWNELKDLSGQAMKDKVKSILEANPGETVPDEKIKPFEIKDSKSWMNFIIKNSGSKNVNPKFLEKMQIDNATVWKEFESFAASNNYDLADIIYATDDSNSSGMSENALIVFASQLDTILGYTSKELNKGSIDAQEYDLEAFKTFIANANIAAKDMGKVINDKVETKSTPITKTTRDIQKGADTNTTAYTELRKTAPDLITELEKTLSPQQVLKVANVIKSKGDNLKDTTTLLSIIKSNPDFIDGRNTDKKINLLAQMQKAGGGTEEQSQVLQAIKSEGIESSFENIDPFVSGAEALEFFRSGKTISDISTEIFDKSKF